MLHVDEHGLLPWFAGVAVATSEPAMTQRDSLKWIDHIKARICLMWPGGISEVCALALNSRDVKDRGESLIDNLDLGKIWWS